MVGELGGWGTPLADIRHIPRINMSMEISRTTCKYGNAGNYWTFLVPMAQLFLL